MTSAMGRPNLISYCYCDYVEDPEASTSYLRAAGDGQLRCAGGATSQHQSRRIATGAHLAAASEGAVAHRDPVAAQRGAGGAAGRGAVEPSVAQAQSRRKAPLSLRRTGR